MHSLRRFAARAALPAVRGVAAKPQTASFAAQFARPSVSAKILAVPSTRFFSQTRKAANAAEEEAASTTEAGAVAAERTGGPKDGETPHSIFIRNLVFQAGEEHVREAFSKYGEVSKVMIARDARGLSKGWGFVHFKEAESVARAVEEANGSFWHGRRIQVAERIASSSSGSERRGASATRAPQEATRSLYIGNIPYETTDAELSRIFRGLENVEDIRIAADHTTGWPRGFAHADFADVESAQRALSKLRGVTIGERELRVDFANPQRRRAGGGGGAGGESAPATDAPFGHEEITRGN